MDYGLRLMGYGLWILGSEFRILALGLGHGLWMMNYGLWVVDKGFVNTWMMGHGLWVADYGI